MQTRTKQGLQVLRRVHDFLADRPFTVPVGDLAGQVAMLGGIVERLAQHAAEQEARLRAGRAATQTKDGLARRLRLELLRPIARYAQSLFPNDAAVRTELRVPRGRDIEGLVATALAMADRVSAHQEAFTSAGFAPDLVTTLRERAAVVAGAVVTRSKVVASRAASTAGLMAELRRGREVVRLIDAMIAPGLADQADQLAEWRSITRFVRTGAGSVAITPAGSTTSPVEDVVKAA